jgi:hypothetical protein
METGGDTIEIRRDWLRLAEIHWRDGSLIEFIFLRKKKREPQRRLPLRPYGPTRLSFRPNYAKAVYGPYGLDI